MAYFEKRYHPPGTPPSTLTEVPATEAAPLRIRLIHYHADDLVVMDDVAASECGRYLQGQGITWAHVQGHPSEAALLELGAVFGLHPLALEDVLNTGQRPKMESFQDQLFVVMSLPLMEEDRVYVDQVSIFLGKNFLVSFCVGDAAFFDPILKRLRVKGGAIRSRRADYLLYGLLDMVIDQGFPVLESFGLQLEEIEEEIIEVSGRDTVEKIHTIKRELILLRRMVWPQREVISQLQRGGHELIDDSTLVYLRDCYDHTIQVMDLMETYRDMTGSMLDIYLSSVSNRMNDIMRVLTVIATIFIPLTFITGIYGMNFERSAGSWNMPELGWAFGYPLVLLVMIVVVVVMVLFFRRRGWF